MQFSVIIPTRNRNDLLSKCLDRLHYNVQQLDKTIYEIIVTDDSENNEAKQLIEQKYPWTRWFEGPKKGPASNRNNGAKNAQGTWLIFLDDDVLPDENILNNYKKDIKQNPDTLAFEGAILPDNWKLLKEDLAECPVNTEGGCFWSANICIEKTLFDKIGGFDEQFLIAAQEDQDLFERLKPETRVKFVKDCLVVHPVRIVSLLSKIKVIPKGIFNWYFFEKKRSSFLICLSRGVFSQLASLYSNLKNFKWKSTVCNILTLIVLLPVLVYGKLTSV